MEKPVKIIVAGAHGRMGQMICRLAKEEKGFELAGAIDLPDALSDLAGLGAPVASDPEVIIASNADAVIIDFTAPAATMNMAKAAARRAVPLVIGTTGFSEAQRSELARLAEKTPILQSANMSIGVNALLAWLPKLARTLGPGYDVEISEIHHRNKKDSPSGTALALGEAVAKARGWELSETRISCRDGVIGARPDRQIGIQALRGGDVVGIHTVYFLGTGESIEVRHEAETRENFAQGALRAARWLAAQKPGRLYAMADALGEEE